MKPQEKFFTKDQESDLIDISRKSNNNCLMNWLNEWLSPEVNHENVESLNLACKYANESEVYADRLAKIYNDSLQFKNPVSIIAYDYRIPQELAERVFCVGAEACES